MEMTVQNGDGGTIRTRDVLQRIPDAALRVPLREIASVTESIALGLRMDMLELGDLGRVSTGAGLGSDAIELGWGERRALIRGAELLRAWVATFDPNAAARFPMGIHSAPQEPRAASPRQIRAADGQDPNLPCFDCPPGSPEGQVYRADIGQYLCDAHAAARGRSCQQCGRAEAPTGWLFLRYETEGEEQAFCSGECLSVHACDAVAPDGAPF